MKRKKILIIGLVGLGDIIIFSPCFKILKQQFPNSDIVLAVSNREVKDLYKHSEYIDEIIYFEPVNSSIAEKIKFIRILRKKKFDISILPFPSYRRETNLISFLAGSKDRYTFSFKNGNFTELTFLNNHKIIADKSIHNVENNFKLIESIGLKVDSQEYNIPLKKIDSFLNDFFSENKITSSDFIIGIHPGTDKRGKDRRLEIKKIAEISDSLVTKYNTKILVFFGYHEDDLIQEFTSNTEKSHIIVNKMDIHNVTNLISSCHIFISADSGLMHLASAMKVPCVSIFGPTNPTYVHPWKVPYEIVRIDLDCSPCFYFTEKHPMNKPLIECKIEDKFKCIKEITNDDVLNKVKKLIKLIYPEQTKKNIHGNI